MESKAFEDGYDAYFFGSCVDDNPYKMTQDEYQEWESGFYQAMSFDYQQEKEAQ